MQLATNNHSAGLDFRSLPAGRRVIVQRETSAVDTEGSTEQTVRRMCEYISQGAADPLIQQIARHAWETYGAGSNDPALKCWAAFWWAKHNVKFRSDEATMFRIGEHDQQDLLIAPALLVRMREPAEDCDGFTMLVAALLCCLGVDVVIATVAVDPRDPSRFSHVFPCALLPAGAASLAHSGDVTGGLATSGDKRSISSIGGNGELRRFASSPLASGSGIGRSDEGGRVLPLDASHGAYPGWMVPAEHISRWQAWDLNGSPVDVTPIKNRGLNGYVQRGVGMYQRLGLGNSCAAGDMVDDYDQPCYTTPVTSPSSVGGTDWSKFFQGIANQGVNLVGKIFTPPAYQSTTRDAAGNLTSTTVRNATGNTALTATGAGLATSPNLVYLGLGALALVAVVAAMKKD